MRLQKKELNQTILKKNEVINRFTQPDGCIYKCVQTLNNLSTETKFILKVVR